MSSVPTMDLFRHKSNVQITHTNKIFRFIAAQILLKLPEVVLLLRLFGIRVDVFGRLYFRRLLYGIAFIIFYRLVFFDVTRSTEHHMH